MPPTSRARTVAGRLPRLSAPLSWLGVAALLAIPAWLAPPLHPDSRWLLHPDQGLHQPLFTLVSCAWLHAHVTHLLANLLGLVLITALAWVMRTPAPFAMAWLLAWPLTHLALLLDPRLHSYYGMSGVLHAGATLVAVPLAFSPPIQRTTSERAIGALLLFGIPLKCVLENPRMQAVIERPDLHMQVAPLSHLSGFLVGLALGVGMLLLRSPSKSRP